MRSYAGEVERPHHTPTSAAVPSARRTAPGQAHLLGLQRSAGNRAVSRLIGHAAVQRCGPVPCDCAETPVQRQDAPVAAPPAQLPPTPPPQPAPPTHLEQWLKEERDAGLLDLPWRGNVPEIPSLPTETPVPGPGGTQPSSGTLGPAPVGPTPGTPFRPPPGPIPTGPPPSTPTGPTSGGPTSGPGTGVGTGVGTGAGAGAGAGLGGLALLAATAAGLVVFFWSTHGPVWGDETSVSGWAFDNENEWKWWHRTLNEEQREYLRMLSRVRREKKDVDVTDVNPLAAPEGLLEMLAEEEGKRTKGKCFAKPVPRRGGNARHDAYATKVTKSTKDYFAATPTGVFINYDGLSDSVLVWEVKVGHGWMFDPDSHQLALRVAAEWDAQRLRGLAVAAACGYQHVWSVTDKWIRESLLIRWGGDPFVFNHPE